MNTSTSLESPGSNESFEPDDFITDETDDFDDEGFEEEKPEHDAYADEYIDVIFEGDTGTLDIAVRRAILALITKPVIYGHKSRDMEKIIQTILLNEDVIRSRLHDLFLDLHIYRDEHAAFTRQIICDESTGVLLNSTPTLTMLDTAVLLALRSYYQEREEEGDDTEAIVIDPEYIKQTVLTRHTSIQDMPNFEKMFNKAWDTFTSWGVLHKISEDFIITEVVKIIMNLDTMHTLLDRVTTQYNELVGSDENASDEEETYTTDLTTSEEQDMS